MGVRLAALDFPKHMRTTVVSPFSVRTSREPLVLYPKTAAARASDPRSTAASTLRGAKRGNVASQRSGNVKASPLPWNWSRMVIELCTVGRMTRVAIAEYCGCDRSLPGEWANGKAKPGAQTADRLVRLFQERIGPELPR